MIIIGIDPGTRVTGYGVVCYEGHRLVVIDFGCIRTPLKVSSAARYRMIFEALEELLAMHQPCAVAVEGQFVHKNPLSAMKLGMARAMALLASERKGIPIFEYAPSRVKKAVVGNGAASKYQVQKMVQMLLGLDEIPTPDDASDALALALCHCNLLKCPYV